MKKPYDIETLLDEVVTLPSLPSAVAHIMKLVSDPQCPLSAVAAAISADPPLAMKTLRLVNAAYYGLRQQVSTIEHAVVLLGIKVIKNLAFTATVFDIMKGSVESFFRHSVATGAAMRVLAESGGVEVAVESGEEAFVCGLLHDIGKVILDEFLPRECAAVDEAARHRRIPFYMAERDIIGVDHAAVGGRLAEKWKLPRELVFGIAGHHNLRYCKEPGEKRVAAFVSIADYMCAASSIGAFENAVVNLDQDTWTASGLSSRNIPALMDNFYKALPSVDELLRVAA